jgi:Tfp pilus assembly protein FimT
MPMWKARPRKARRRAAGFATVEVLVTVAIVVLVGTIAIFALGRTDRAQLQNDVASVALVLQQARLQAAETGQPIEVIYSQEDRSVTTETGGHEFGRGVTSPTESARIMIRPSGENEGLDLVLVAGAETRSVEIDWLTGQIRVAP